MALIEMRDVRKTYIVGDQKIHALDGVTLDINAGEYVSIIGPSGSGKSTFMQILGCLNAATSGEVILDGVDISRASNDDLSHMRNEKIGFVFQSFNLLPRLNVLENVELPMIYAVLPRKERHERARRSIEAVGLTQRIHNRPSQLSGGQSQRVAIASALVNDPKIILADEPTGALDTLTGEAILKLFRELNQKGHTVALVTHDPDIAAETPRRIELRDGKLVDSTHSHYVRFRTEAQATPQALATASTPIASIPETP